MDAAATACPVDKMERDLRVAGLDADQYAQASFELLECRMPSALILEDEHMLTLLLHRLVCLIGSLEQGRRLARELREMGVVL